MIENGKYYHIYNRGTNSQKIFLEERDYIHFLNLATIFLYPIAEVYAYALMGNHFHLVLRIKKDDEIGYLNPKYANSDDLTLKWKTGFFEIDEERLNVGYDKKPVPKKMLQHFFSAYAKWFNKKHDRSGSLLEHPYDRIEIKNERYLKNLILYIHNNPVKHGICEHPMEYGWTSYLSMVSIKPSKLARKTVVGWFNDTANFVELHKNKEYDNIKNLLLE